MLATQTPNLICRWAWLIYFHCLVSMTLFYWSLDLISMPDLLHICSYIKTHASIISKDEELVWTPWIIPMRSCHVHPALYQQTIVVDTLHYIHEQSQWTVRQPPLNPWPVAKDSLGTLHYIHEGCDGHPPLHKPVLSNPWPRRLISCGPPVLLEIC